MRRVSVLTFVLLVGCADHGAEGMFILNNTAAPVGTVCSFTGDPLQPFTAHGAIYAGSPTPYLFTPLIESLLTSPSVAQNATHTIHLQGADIILSQADSSGKLNEVARYTSLFAGSVAPGADTNVSFNLIPVSRLATIMAGGQDAEMSANVTVYGSEGGGRIDALPFDYPVSVCTNCIVVNHGACPLVSSTQRLGDPCNPFQDGIVDCCTDATGLVCPGPT